MEPPNRGVWRFVSVINGALCAINCGMKTDAHTHYIKRDLSKDGHVWVHAPKRNVLSSAAVIKSLKYTGIYTGGFALLHYLPLSLPV